MKPKFIIIHNSATKDSGSVSWAAIRRYHVETNGWSAIGYHFGIERVGDHFEVLLGRMGDIEGAHCRAGGMNGKSLGVCCVGDFDHQAPPQAQIDKLVNLVRYLMYIHNIPKENVKRHADYEHTKSCPGIMFPWKEFKDRLGQYDQMAKSH